MRAILRWNQYGVAGVALFLLLSSTGVVEADRCTCDGLFNDKPYKQASNSGEIAVMAYEPAQRAVILWNGKEEILFLSTDLSFRTDTVLTEVLPFPALPTARIGSVELFSELATLLHKKDGQPADWLPSFPVSTMSNIQVYAWREISAHTIATLGSPSQRLSCRTILNRYRSRGYEYMVFDEVEVRTGLQSFKPIEYRFRSDKVYYPLEISTVDYGQTKVDLFIISAAGVSQIGATDYPATLQGTYSLETGELQRLSPEWAGFMGGQPVTLQHIRMVGDIRKMNKDFLAK